MIDRHEIHKVTSVLEYFNYDYDIRVPVSDLIAIGGEDAIRKLIAEDKIYFSGRLRVSLVNNNDGFIIDDYCYKIKEIVDKKGEHIIKNLFYYTGSNKRGYEVVRKLKNDGYFVDVTVNELKADVVIRGDVKYIKEAVDTNTISTSINDRNINNKVQKKISKIGKLIDKKSKKPAFSVFYHDYDLYNNSTKVDDIVIKRLTDLGYTIKRHYVDNYFLFFKCGVKYGILIYW